jgi:hypothetical protein
VDLADILLHWLGIASRLPLRARGFGLLLSLPLIIVGVVDWHIARKR